MFDEITTCFQRQADTVKRRRTVTSKLDKLYELFHEFSVSKEANILLTDSEKKLEMQLPDILWQMLIEKEFISFLRKKFASALDNERSQPDSDRQLLEIEKNAVRYTAGYVVRKLEEKYAKQKSKESREHVLALKAMAGKLSSESTRSLNLEQPSNEDWLMCVNRGGLYFVEDIVYDLFVCIEMLVDSKLTEILQESGTNIHQVKKENLAWVCKDEDVQSVWDEISSNLLKQEKEICQDVLKDITHMWITTRGHSKVHRIKEEYKQKQKRSVKGTRSLRKELESQ